MKHSFSSRIETIIDANTILMNDGKIVRLLGVEYPQSTNGDDNDIMVNAKAALEKMLHKGDEFMVWQTLGNQYGRTNRMGHILAHLQNKKTGEWVNGVLVAQGLAWAMTDKSNSDMAAPLYALEDAARKANKGIWTKGSPYGVLSADDASKGEGRIAIVEGVITKASGAKNNLFLNFGNDSKKDFTVMISPALRKIFARKGIDVLALAGKHVRVRGWIRHWNGPFMELETAERLEILSTPPSTGLSPDMSTAPPPPKATGQSNP